MYEHYPVTGNVQQIPDAQAHQLMNTISPQWEDETTPFGKLYMGVFDWAYSNTPNGMQLHIPNLASGGSIPLNTNATQKFGFDIYGDCFLKL
jgi:hypothetical protein